MKKKNDTSPRSRLEEDKGFSKLKPGQAHQDDFLKLIIKMFKGVDVDIMECNKVPEVVLDFQKKDKTKLN